MTYSDRQTQALPMSDADLAPATTDLAAYLPQVAAEAVAKVEDADLDKVNDLYNDRVRYVARQTLAELREYSGKYGTITGFAYSETALKFAWSYKRTEGRQTVILPDPTDAGLTDILNVIYTARQGADLTLRAMANCLEYLDIHPDIPDTAIAAIRQVWNPVKGELDNINHKADLFEMAITRYGTDIDNLIDLIQKGNDND